MEEPYNDFVNERLKAGDDPNEIIGKIEDAIIPQAVEQGWALFGDGNWRRDTCCSICGLWTAGICGHQDDPNQRVIPRSEFLAKFAVTPAEW